MSNDVSTGSRDPLRLPNEAATPPTDADSLSRAGSGPVQQSMTGLPNASLREAIVSDEIQAVLKKAGLQKMESGAIAILDVKSTPGAEGLSPTQQVYGAGETQLKPAAPPPVTIDSETVSAAQSFATNFDIGMNNYLLTSDPTKGVGHATNYGQSTLSGGSDALYTQNLAELSADDLLAAFLKVNITDPNNNPETHNKLHEISSNMRQLAIDEAKKRIERAQEAKKEAEQYAKQAEYISTVVTVVSLVASVFTMGASLAGTAAMQAGKEGVMSGVRETVKQIVQQVKTAIKELFQKLFQEGTAKVTQETAKQITTTVTQEATKVTQAAAQDLAKQFAQEEIQKLGTDQFTDEMKEQVVERVRERLQDALANQGQDFASQVMSDSSIQQLMQTAPEQLQQPMQEGLNAGIEQGLDAAAETGVDQALNPPSEMVQFLAKNETAINNIGTATVMGGQVVEAGAKYKEAMLHADAAEWRNEAARFELVGDMHQNMIENEADIMKEIMESKNQVVDSVMSMMNASFVSSQKLIAAAASRG